MKHLTQRKRVERALLGRKSYIDKSTIQYVSFVSVLKNLLYNLDRVLNIIFAKACLIFLTYYSYYALIFLLIKFQRYLHTFKKS